MKRIVKRCTILLVIVLSFNFIFIPLQNVSVIQSASGNNAYAAVSSQYRYCRTKLTNKTQRYIYDKYLDAIKKGKSACSFNDKKYTMSEDNFLVAEYAIFLDYPELFYWKYYESAYWMNGTGKNKKIYKVEIYYNKELKAKAKEYEARANAIVASIPESCVTAYDKALYLQDFICSITTYNDKSTRENPNPDEQQTCFGPVIYGESVCEGYARAYQDLLRRAGIKALTVYGYSLMPEGNEFDPFTSYIKYKGRYWAYHAWNEIWLDGKCYYADPTYADREDGQYSYENFCKSREEFDEEYYVRDGEKPNKAITKFMDRVYGKCGHQSLRYIDDEAITIEEPLTYSTIKTIADNFGPTKEYLDPDDNLNKYIRTIYICYSGKENFSDWVDEHDWKIQDAAGMIGNERWYIIDEEEGGYYRYSIISMVTTNEIFKEELSNPVVAVMRNASKKQIKLLWYEVKDAEKYVIYRKAGQSGEYEEIAATTRLKYTDKDLNPKTKYYYKVEPV